MGKKHVLTVAGRYDEIKTICQFVMQGAAAAGLDETAVFHIELACDEACTNIIEHAYGGEDNGSITISWQVEAGMFVITLKDNGRAFNVDQIPAAPDTDNIENIKIGGLGIHFMRKLMDDVQFSTEPPTGNKLVMKKKMATPKEKS
jgi:anti-sigma regulatory factor (Ser/Thr protein kinase)